MKKPLFILILLLSQVIQVYCQDEPAGKSSGTDNGEIKTLFKKSDHPKKVGYYISPEFAYTQFEGRDVFLGGLSLGVIVNHFFSVGLGAKGILNSGNLWYDFDGSLDAPVGAYLYGGYGGVKFEFKLLPTSPLHVNFPILIGGGGLTYYTGSMHNHNYNNNNGTTLDWDAFFVVEPGVMLEINLLKFMQLDAGISYRYTPDLDLMETSAGLINNFNANLSLKFGKF
ncbi:MAG: hypothetical protein WCK09_18800 [Bacteroidota bacterium]